MTKQIEGLEVVCFLYAVFIKWQLNRSELTILPMKANEPQQRKADLES